MRPDRMHYRLTASGSGPLESWRATEVGGGLTAELHRICPQLESEGIWVAFSSDQIEQRRSEIASSDSVCSLCPATTCHSAPFSSSCDLLIAEPSLTRSRGQIVDTRPVLTDGDSYFAVYIDGMEEASFTVSIEAEMLCSEQCWHHGPR